MDAGPKQDLWNLLPVIIVLLLGAAYFAIMETAFSSASRIRLKAAADHGNRRAGQALYVLDHFDQAITTLLIGTNILHLTIATIVTVAVQRVWGMWAVTAATLVTTVVVFFAGEMLPKSIAKKYAERLAMATARSLRFFMVLFQPLSVLLTAIGSAAARCIRGEPAVTVTEDELADIIENMTDDGELTAERGELMSSALSFAEVPVESVITARVDVAAVDVDAIKKAALRIGFDPMYGVSWSSLSMLLTTCRCDLEVIHDRHDTLFGGKLPAPNVDTLKPLAALVLDKHCDLGIATDGDADRLGVIDNEGQFVSPNKLLVLLYYYLVKYRGWHGPCVRNNSTSHLLDRVAEGLGEKCYEVPVGFKWVSAKMAETDAVIGGESSGGMAVRGHISGKDGIYAAALLVEKKIIRKELDGLKVLGNGELTKKLTVKAVKFTGSAKEKIEAVGGTAEVI